MTELKVKGWVIDKAQDTAQRYNVFIDTKPVDDEYVIVKVEEILKESEKAVQVRLSSGDIVGSVKGWEMWIPKSQIA